MSRRTHRRRGQADANLGQGSFSRSAERSELLIEWEARITESLSDVAQNARAAQADANLGQGSFSRSAERSELLIEWEARNTESLSDVAPNVRAAQVDANFDQGLYIYIAVCKNFEPLIYISIYIYGVHCGKVLILKTVPGCRKIINM